MIRRRRRPDRTTQAERRARLRELLDVRDEARLLAWARQEPRAASTVIAAIFETDDLRRWRAIEALGTLAEDAARKDLETVRDWVRRIFWNMMEESGGLMWHGPEAIGEMLARVPPLIREFASPLGSYRAEEPFEAGTYTALARLALVDPETIREIVPYLVSGLRDPDPRIRAHAALAVFRSGADAGRSAAERLWDDDERIVVYDRDSGALRETTVGDLVRGCLS